MRRGAGQARRKRRGAGQTESKSCCTPLWLAHHFSKERFHTTTYLRVGERRAGDGGNRRRPVDSCGGWSRSSCRRGCGSRHWRPREQLEMKNKHQDQHDGLQPSLKRHTKYRAKSTGQSGAVTKCQITLSLADPWGLLTADPIGQGRVGG